MRKNQAIFASLLLVGIILGIFSIKISNKLLKKGEINKYPVKKFIFRGNKPFTFPQKTTFSFSKPTNQQNQSLQKSENKNNKINYHSVIEKIQSNKTKKAEKQTTENQEKSFNTLATTTQPTESTQSPEDEFQSNDSLTSAYNSYLTQLLNVWSKVGFQQSDFNLLPKTANKRILSVEEIIQKIIKDGYSEKFISALSIWEKLDSDSYEKLKNLKINPLVSSYHKNLLDWYNYRLNFIENIIKNKPPKTILEKSFNDYQNRASNYLSSIPRIKQKESFSIIPKTSAHVTPFYDFGGKVTGLMPCDNGTAVVILPPPGGVPRGGVLWIYYAVWAANPFLYKNLAVGCDTIGRAIWGPGFCNMGPVTVTMGIAQIIFFGTTPGPVPNI